MSSEPYECVGVAPLQCDTPIESMGSPTTAVVRAFRSGVVKITCTHLRDDKCFVSKKECPHQEKTDESKAEPSIQDSVGFSTSEALEAIKDGQSLKAVVNQFEREIIEVILAESDGQRTSAAKILQMATSTLFNKMQKLNMPNKY